MTFEVRRATSAEIDQLVTFQLALAQESEGLALKQEIVRAGVLAVFQDARRGHYWVVAQSGVVVGCLLTQTEWSDWRNGEVWWIHSVYVVEEARGKGAFKALFQSLRARVEETPGVFGLRLYVDKTNQRAEAVYRALGMIDEHYSLFELMV